MARGVLRCSGAMPLSSLDRLSSAFAGLIDGLCDPRRRRRVALALVCAYAAAWTLYGVVAKSSQDINADMAEQVIWSREPALGYPKHPPLLAYAVKLWFAVFPPDDWAFILLAVINVSAGLYLAFELAGIWLDGEKRAAAPFLLAAVPFYNFLGLKLDQNAALIPLWALALWALLRSLSSPRSGWAALTGLAAAAALLTKYWSVMLLAAMALAILTDRRRNAYLRSPAPWLAALVFLAAVLPHAVWLIEERFPPLTWVATRRLAQSNWDYLRSLAEFTFGTIGYAAPALIVAALLIRPSAAAVRDSWFAVEPGRRPATVLFWTPLVLPIAVSAAFGIALLSLWNSPALSLLPVMLLASPLIQVPRIAVMRLAAIVTALTVIVVAASPLVALVKLKTGVENNAAYANLAAAAAERQWRETVTQPLRLVGGPFALASSAAFYMSDKPSTYADFSPYLSPWVTQARIAREGIAIICPADDDGCLDGMNTLAAAGPPGRRSNVTLTRYWLGVAGPPRRFVIATVPPRS
jgi:4-amino-4-deoxy-L-arabinose transferase-like glycosyltransferase